MGCLLCEILTYIIRGGSTESTSGATRTRTCIGATANNFQLAVGNTAITAAGHGPPTRAEETRFRSVSAGENHQDWTQWWHPYRCIIYRNPDQTCSADINWATATRLLTRCAHLNPCRLHFHQQHVIIYTCVMCWGALGHAEGRMQACHERWHLSPSFAIAKSRHELFAAESWQPFGSKFIRSEAVWSRWHI